MKPQIGFFVCVTWPQLNYHSSLTCISECGTPSWACFEKIKTFLFILMHILFTDDVWPGACMLCILSTCKTPNSRPVLLNWNSHDLIYRICKVIISDIILTITCDITLLFQVSTINTLKLPFKVVTQMLLLWHSESWFTATLKHLHWITATLKYLRFELPLLWVAAALKYRRFEVPPVPLLWSTAALKYNHNCRIPPVCGSFHE